MEAKHDKAPRSPRFMRTFRKKKDRSKSSLHHDTNRASTPRGVPSPPPRPDKPKSKTTEDIGAKKSYNEIVPGRRMTLSPETFKELDDKIINNNKVESLKFVSSSSAGQLASPRIQEEGDPLEAIRNKIILEEEMLEKQREAVRNFSGSDKKELAELKESVAVRVTLISALRQNLTFQNENLITNGYVKVRKDQEDEFISYWVVIEFPNLQFFVTESVNFNFSFQIFIIILYCAENSNFIC